MSERDDGCVAWLIVAVLLIILYAHVKIHHFELRDLQRRVGQLEMEQER